MGTPEGSAPGNRSFSRRTAIGAGVAAMGAVLIPKGAISAQMNSDARTGSSASTALLGGIVSRWEQDQWARGSYSVLPPGVSPNVRKVLSQASVQQRIVFAGEYCDPAFPGTMQGALRSGIHAAEHLSDVSVGVSGKTVVVIGAGLAGLAAASELQALGASVRIVEARSRVGGRVKTDYSLGVPLEVGPSWIHARRNNPVAPLLERAGLTTVKASYKTRARSARDGKPDQPANKSLRELQGILASSTSTAPKTSQSIAQWLAQNSWSEKSNNQKWASDVELTQDFGLDAAKVSVESYFEGREYLGGDGLVAGGLNNLTDMLARGLNIELDSPVAKVSAAGAGVQVELQSGEQVSGDLAVVAVPVALLQAQLPVITGISPQVQAAISSLETGNLEKAALVFDDQWWLRPQKTVPVLGVTADARWTAFYDMTEVTGVPTLFGLTGGKRSTTRPATDQVCLQEAFAAVSNAWKPRAR